MNGNNPYAGGHANSGGYPHGEQNPHGRDPFLGDPMGGMPDFQNPNNPIAEEYQEFVDQQSQPLPGFPAGYPSHYPTQYPAYQQPNRKPLPSEKNRVLAAVLALFLGTLGIHNFYLGFDNRAKWQLGLTITGVLTTIFLVGILILMVVGIWAFVDFVLILLKSGPYDKDGDGDYLR